MAGETGISYGSSLAILTKDFGMRHISAKFVSWLLAQDQKENCLSVASYLLEWAEINENS
jgi:hypothetical protein